MTGPCGRILGWDVGGANLKVARLDDGRMTWTALERPFPLWREVRRLPSALVDLAGAIGWAEVMAVTMTAELADCFATKQEGVASIVGAFQTAFPSAMLWIYGVDGRFRLASDAVERPLEVAAANWMASAVMVARTCPDALFIDVGSTTTDLIPIVDHRVAPSAWTDLTRLVSGELVYTGYLRTPVCAIVGWVPLAAGPCRVAAEHFAIAADVYRWLGQLSEAAYTCDTPDGRGRSRSEAGARLARVVCADRDTLGTDDVTAIAEHVAHAQQRQIVHGIRQVTRRLGAVSPRLAVVAGSGACLGLAAARQAGLEVRDLAADIGADAARAVPAAAVAYLLADSLASSPA